MRSDIVLRAVGIVFDVFIAVQFDVGFRNLGCELHKKISHIIGNEASKTIASDFRCLLFRNGFDLFRDFRHFSRFEANFLAARPRLPFVHFSFRYVSDSLYDLHNPMNARTDN